jgi:hypothetical protein
MLRVMLISVFMRTLPRTMKTSGKISSIGS